MAYSKANQPRMTLQNIGVGPRQWLYSSADAAATVIGAGYFTDGAALGMKQNDICYVHNTAGKIMTCHWVNVVAGVVTLGAATTIATNA